MPETSLQKLIRYHSRNVSSRRAELVGIGDKLGARLAEINQDRYLSADDRSRQSARARDEVSSKIRPAVAAVEEALEEARRFTDSELNKLEPSERAQSRVRRLLDRDVAPSDIVARAERLGDRETLGALRDELRWGLGPGSPEFLGQLERKIAAMTPDAGKQFGELADLLDSAGIKEAQKLAISAVAGEKVGAARMAYAYATNDAGEEGESGDGD